MPSGFAPDSSQGFSFGGIDGLTNVKISKKGTDPTSTSNKLDASTLALSEGSNRVYVDGLPDPGAAATEAGVAVTVTVSFISNTPPAAGDETSYDGVDLVCTEAEVEYAVGELVKGTATFVTKPPAAS